MIFRERGRLPFFILLSLLFQTNSWSAGDLTVTYFSCGQGDAALLQTPHGKNILIDAGPHDPEGEFDAGRDILDPFFKKNNIHKIHYAVLSHGHLDHMGGFYHILKNYPVDIFYDPGFKNKTPEYKELKRLLKQKKVPIRIVRSGKKLKWDPDLDIRILGPPKKLPWENANDNSLVMQIQHGEVKFLFTGDVEEESEYEMVIHHGNNLSSQILKIPHHGSSTSTTQEFLSHVNPELAIVSCGRRNPFGHPHQDVLERVDSAGIKLHRTDKNGSVVIISNGKTYHIK